MSYHMGKKLKTTGNTVKLNSSWKNFFQHGKEKNCRDGADCKRKLKST